MRRRRPGHGDDHRAAQLASRPRTRCASGGRPGIPPGQPPAGCGGLKESHRDATTRAYHRRRIRRLPLRPAAGAQAGSTRSGGGAGHPAQLPDLQSAASAGGGGVVVPDGGGYTAAPHAAPHRSGARRGDRTGPGRPRVRGAHYHRRDARGALRPAGAHPGQRDPHLQHPRAGALCPGDEDAGRGGLPARSCAGAGGAGRCRLLRTGADRTVHVRRGRRRLLRDRDRGRAAPGQHALAAPLSASAAGARAMDPGRRRPADHAGTGRQARTGGH